MVLMVFSPRVPRRAVVRDQALRLVLRLLEGCTVQYDRYCRRRCLVLCHHIVLWLRRLVLVDISRPDTLL